MAAIFGEGKKEIEANLCFAIFGKNSKIKMAAIFGEGKKEIEANSCFAIFGKNSKNQNGRHFWGGEIFLKIAKITFLRYPAGRKFRRNRSISHG